MAAPSSPLPARCYLLHVQHLPAAQARLMEAPAVAGLQHGAWEGSCDGAGREAVDGQEIAAGVGGVAGVAEHTDVSVISDRWCYICGSGNFLICDLCTGGAAAQGTEPRIGGQEGMHSRRGRPAQ